MKKGKYGAVSTSRISLAYIVRFYFFSFFALENEASRLSHRGLAIIESGGGDAVRRRIYCNNMHRGSKSLLRSRATATLLHLFLSSGQGIFKLLLQEDAARRPLALHGRYLGRFFITCKTYLYVGNLLQPTTCRKESPFETTNMEHLVKWEEAVCAKEKGTQVIEHFSPVCLSLL